MSAKRQKKRKINSGLSRYNSVLKILSSYTKKNDIKLGKKFNSLASKIYKENKDVPLKQIQSNIDIIFSGVTEEGRLKSFEEKIPFFLLGEELLLPMYEDVVLTFNSGMGEFGSKTGSGEEIFDWFISSGLYNKLRAVDRFNTESAYSVFLLEETDNRKWANYKLVLPPGGEKFVGKGEFVKPSIQDEIKLNEAMDRRNRSERDLFDRLIASGISPEDAMKFIKDQR